MAIEIVDFPIKHGGSFHCYVSSPEGTPMAKMAIFWPSGLGKTLENVKVIQTDG